MAIPNTSEKPLFEAAGAAIAEVSAAPSAPPKASDIRDELKNTTSLENSPLFY